ncbi:hypothetical protein PGT21_034075 [Puccinia graminis f. sp. tritici]|uniref:Uncharacterized protein n=1 Tax=Puccinia graminis f. sp. tritici TaxID=56615 RepID=A0A5B0MYG0_PUCGR|nr:hypothetical protein PGT21_034075 [Puccinia graminis f. sp. tritici]
MVFSCTSCKPMSPSGMATNLFCAIVLISLTSSVSAFGSGNIPDAAYLKGKAWRHGDIEGDVFLCDIQRLSADQLNFKTDILNFCLATHRLIRGSCQSCWPGWGCNCRCDC